MYLQAISHAVPQTAYTQRECWELLQKSAALPPLSTRSRALLEKILLGDSGIHKRHFTTDDLPRLFSLDAEGLHRHFAHAAPELGEQALRRALTKAGIAPRDPDALFVCTCTGYLCPGLSSHLAERCQLRPDVFLQDLVGLGCGAGPPTLRAANGFLAANPGATALCVAVEICSAAFYLDNDPGVLVSACLFADAASASVWTADKNGVAYRMENFDTIHRPEKRELLRFTNTGGKLRNQLDRAVPETAAREVRTLHERAEIPENTPIAAHGGGRDVIEALEAALPVGELGTTRKTLAAYGNVSSPSSLITLESRINQRPAPENVWLASFGAGFTAHSAMLTRNGNPDTT